MATEVVQPQQSSTEAAPQSPLKISQYLELFSFVLVIYFVFVAIGAFLMGSKSTHHLRYITIYFFYTTGLSCLFILLGLWRRRSGTLILFRALLHFTHSANAILGWKLLQQTHDPDIETTLNSAFIVSFLLMTLPIAIYCLDVVFVKVTTGSNEEGPALPQVAPPPAPNPNILEGTDQAIELSGCSVADNRGKFHYWLSCLNQGHLIAGGNETEEKELLLNQPEDEIV